MRLDFFLHSVGFFLPSKVPHDTLMTCEKILYYPIDSFPRGKRLLNQLRFLLSHLFFFFGSFSVLFFHFLLFFFFFNKSHCMLENDLALLVSQRRFEDETPGVTRHTSLPKTKTPFKENNNKTNRRKGTV